VADERGELVDPDGEIVLPRRHVEHDTQLAVGTADATDVEVATDDRVEQLVHAADRLDGGDRIVDRRRDGTEGDVDEQPEGEQRVLVEGSVLSGVDQA
jgi:hypothetical protein